MSAAAVAVATPDHSHFPIAMLALSYGKHVYLEKPMCRTFHEAELLMEAAKKHPGVVTQVGNQGHSEANYFQFKAWTEAGIIKDVTDILADAAPFFGEGRTIKAVAVDKFDKTRKFIDALTEKVKQNGAENMYWLRLDESGAPAGGIAKFVGDRLDALRERLGLVPGGFAAFVAEKSGAEKQAGFLRTELGVGLDLLEKDAFRFCWIVDFPMYEYDDEGNLTFCHNPFSMPQGGMDALNSSDPLSVLAYQYDSVVNGVELSSGAVRNHEPAIMEKAFEIVGYGKDVIEKKFSALYNAFKFGAPPHAGIAPGVDRIVMLLTGESNIREVITFPMDRNARDPLMGAPSEVTERQLRDVHIKLDLPEEKGGEDAE